MKSARQLLREARELFNSTHWMKGEFVQYNDDEDKTFYCAVGGLRHVAELSAEGFQPGDYDPAQEAEYYAALEPLARIALDRQRALLEKDPDYWPEGRVRDLHEWASTLEGGSVSPQTYELVESLVVTYNDDTGTDLDGILSLFDEADAALEKAGAPA